MLSPILTESSFSAVIGKEKRHLANLHHESLFSAVIGKQKRHLANLHCQHLKSWLRNKSVGLKNKTAIKRIKVNKAAKKYVKGPLGGNMKIVKKTSSSNLVPGGAFLKSSSKYFSLRTKNKPTFT